MIGGLGVMGRPGVIGGLSEGVSERGEDAAGWMGTWKGKGEAYIGPVERKK